MKQVTMKQKHIPMEHIIWLKEENVLPEPPNLKLPVVGDTITIRSIQFVFVAIQLIGSKTFYGVVPRTSLSEEWLKLHNVGK